MLRPHGFIVALLLWPTTATWADQDDECRKLLGQERALRQCKHIILRSQNESKKAGATAGSEKCVGYTGSIALKPGEDPNIYICVGAKPDLAICTCTHVIESGKRAEQVRLLAYSHRAAAFQKKGDYDLAIADYNKVIELNPHFAGAYYRRALAYESQGDKDQAIADLRKVLEIDPSNTDAKDALKRLGSTP